MTTFNTRIIVIISLILLSRTKALCQQYLPFDFEHGQWICYYSTKGGLFGSYGGDIVDYIEENVKFYCNGDTVIDDTLFKKLYYTGFAKPTLTPQVHIEGYYGAIRNDTANKKVWLKSDYGYGCLYDFNLKVGDYYIYSCSEPAAKIDLIDSAMYCNKFHRRYHYSNGYLIEGIGSSDGLIPVNCMTSASSLICYSEKGESCDTCQTPTRIQEIIRNNLKVFPNPTTGEINISSADPILSLEVRDLTGRIIYKYNDVFVDTLKFQLPSAGIYLLLIKTKDNLIVRKIIRE